MRRLILSLIIASAPSVAFADSFQKASAIANDAKALSTKASEAERLFREVPASSPHAAKAQYNLGLLLERRNDFNGAREAYNKSLSIDAGFNGSKARLAGLDLKQASTRAAAIAKLQEIIKTDSFQSDARNLLAEVEIARGTDLLAKKDSKGAVAAFDEAIRHGRNVLLGDPDNIHAFVNVSIAYLRQGLNDQAGLIASNALEKHKEAAPLHNIMGLVYLSQDNSRAATESFLEALKNDPSNDDARLNLAALELAYGNFASALERFDEALKVQPDNTELIVSRAVALRGLNRFDEADKAYQLARSRDPDNADISYNLCVLHQQYTQKFDVAKTHCEAYFGKISKGHPKFAEMQRRVRSIEATLKALGKVP